MSRFKIDFSQSAVYPFALYFNRGRLWDAWERLDTFKTRDEAKDLYERIKDLPEYLP